MLAAEKRHSNSTRTGRSVIRKSYTICIHFPLIFPSWKYVNYFLTTCFTFFDSSCISAGSSWGISVFSIISFPLIFHWNCYAITQPKQSSLQLLYMTHRRCACTSSRYIPCNVLLIKLIMRYIVNISNMVYFCIFGNITCTNFK